MPQNWPFLVEQGCAARRFLPPKRLLRSRPGGRPGPQKTTVSPLTGQSFRRHEIWSTWPPKTGRRQKIGPVKESFNRPHGRLEGPERVGLRQRRAVLRGLRAGWGLGL